MPHHFSNSDRFTVPEKGQPKLEKLLVESIPRAVGNGVMQHERGPAAEMKSSEDGSKVLPFSERDGPNRQR